MKPSTCPCKKESQIKDFLDTPDEHKLSVFQSLHPDTQQNILLPKKENNN